MKGLIFDIKKFAVNDGPGIRTAVYLSGCPLECWWCHNPECLIMPNDSSQSSIDINNLNHKKIRWIESDALLIEIEKDRVFFDESSGGVTFSGGEPLYQHEFLFEVAQHCRQQGMHTALDTCGYAEFSVFEKAIQLFDLFLFDLKLTDVADHLKYTAASNSIIHSNLRILALSGKPIIIRIPVIPGITDTESNYDGILELLTSLSDGSIKRIDLLPYHSLARHKYEKSTLVNKLSDLADLEPAKLENARLKFIYGGFVTGIGGMDPI